MSVQSNSERVFEGWFAAPLMRVKYNALDGTPEYLVLHFVRKRRGAYGFTLKLKLAHARALADALVLKLDELDGI